MSRKHLFTSILTSATLLGLAVVAVPSSVASALPQPIAQPAAGMPSATALPTTQIDGVVWSQEVVGNTVYVGGDFDNARPAGAAAGVNDDPAPNLLSYNLTPVC